MKQNVEIFFAVAPDNTVEAVLLNNEGAGPMPQQIAFGYRLVGPRAVMDPLISLQWNAVAVCTPEFVKANKAKPAAGRPVGIKLCFLNET